MKKIIPLAQRQIARARQHRNLNQTQKPRPQVIKQPSITKIQFMKALEGTCGIIADIARNIGCHRNIVARAIERPDWADMQVLYVAECANKHDRALSRVMHAITDSTVDEAVATQNARWLLSKIDKGTYGEQSKTIIEGGDKPVQLQSLNISVDVLSLPVEVKRQILNAADEHHKKLDAARNQLNGDMTTVSTVDEGEDE